ncbi:hypothetical protein MY8738_006276 [Beauveria namnaoensis]
MSTPPPSPPKSSRRSMNGIIVLGDSDDELLDVDDHEMQQLPCMTCLDKA